MNFEPLPIPERERLIDYSVRLIWKDLTVEQIHWLINRSYFFKDVVFADLGYYGQVFSIDIKIGPDEKTTLYFPKSEVGTMTDEMVRMVIEGLTSLPVDRQPTNHSSNE